MPAFKDGTWLCVPCEFRGKRMRGTGGMQALMAHQESKECLSHCHQLVSAFGTDLCLTCGKRHTPPVNTEFNDLKPDQEASIG